MTSRQDRAWAELMAIKQAKQAGQKKTGLFHTLTPAQQARALTYKGPENITPPKSQDNYLPDPMVIATSTQSYSSGSDSSSSWSSSSSDSSSSSSFSGGSDF